MDIPRNNTETYLIPKTTRLYDLILEPKDNPGGHFKGLKVSYEDDADSRAITGTALRQLAFDLDGKGFVDAERHEYEVKAAALLPLQTASVKDGDIVCVRIEDLSMLGFKGIEAALRTAYPDHKPHLICCVNPGDSIEAVDEKQMAVHGWVRSRPADESAPLISPLDDGE